MELIMTDSTLYYGEVLFFDPKGDMASSSGKRTESNKKICSAITAI